METIVPSVEGSTMVFSTHSFSPFGIAGSKPLVGGEIQEDGYGDLVTRATVTPTASAGVTAVPEKVTAAVYRSHRMTVRILINRQIHQRTAVKKLKKMMAVPNLR